MYVQKFLEYPFELTLILLEIGRHPSPASQDPLAVRTASQAFLVWAFAPSYLIEFAEELFAFGRTSCIIIRMLLAQKTCSHPGLK